MPAQGWLLWHEYEKRRRKATDGKGFYAAERVCSFHILLSACNTDCHIVVIGVFII